MGNLLACFVYADRRIMGFRWRHGPDEPDAQVIEACPRPDRGMARITDGSSILLMTRMAPCIPALAGKAVVQITAVEIAIDHLLDIGTPETVLT